jgi:formylglycine-generating enzyme required for sulfatase activity
MVFIPEGGFIMGKNTETARDWQPEHSVRVDFAVGFRCVKDIQ